jgi:tRNA-Thr(GGU) m(6)t(6)A37 methyltransferase TsaA
MPFQFEPIGFVVSPFGARAEAPRQGSLAGGASGRIELSEGRGFEDALSGLDEWEYLWVLFVFHRNVEEGRGWKPKVLPPRATAKQGVFATRSPHRPNPIGLSAVRLERVEGLVLHVRELDLLDGTPVLDLKPYVPYADARPTARSGWLEARDPLPAWTVEFSPLAEEELTFLAARGVVLRGAIEKVLALGPQPHAYRRIRKHGDGMRLALKEWRIDFVVDEVRRALRVGAIAPGFPAKDLEEAQANGDDGLEVHRAFVEAFRGRK